MESKTANKIHTNLFAKLPHNNILTVIAVKINEPPIVGVPVFTKWVCGPSVRMACPTFNSVSLRIVQGPNNRQKESAVNEAITVRKVVY